MYRGQPIEVDATGFWLMSASKISVDKRKEVFIFYFRKIKCGSWTYNQVVGGRVPLFRASAELNIRGEF